MTSKNEQINKAVILKPKYYGLKTDGVTHKSFRMLDYCDTKIRLTNFFFFLCVISRCFVDCGAIVSSSSKFRVTSECQSPACVGASYQWSLEKLQQDTKAWEIVSNLVDITATPINATNIIIKGNTLLSNSRYRLKLIVASLMGAEGYAVLEFETAGQPYGGYCRPSVSEGVSLETEFEFECFNWQDKSTPLAYEFRRGNEPMSYGLSSKSVPVVMPAGLPENNYVITTHVVITNTVGVAVIQSLNVMVRYIFFLRCL